MDKIDFEALKKGDFIFTPTAHHTGTWFLLRFLLNHTRVYGVVEYHEIEKGQVTVEHLNKRVVHAHVGKKMMSSGILGETLSVNQAIELSRHVKTIIPVRDPLRMLISRESRHPELTHEFQVYGFSRLQEFDAVYMPIDLYESTECRSRLLTETLAGIGYGHEPYVEWWAENWPRHNTAGSNELVEMYDNGDVEGIRKVIPREFDLLMDMSEEIIPFLKGLGYTNMIWWDV